MKRLFFLLAIVSLVVFSCKKATEDKPDPFNANDNVTASTNNSIASIMFDDVYRQVDYTSTKMNDSVTGKKSTYETLSGYPVFTLDSGLWDLTTFPKYFTVDFGTTGVLCNDQRTRKGKVHFKATNWMHNPGSVCTVTADNYYVDGYKVEGHKTITNQGLNSSQHLVYHVVVTNGVITHPTGEHHTWATDRYTEWINGGNTLLNFSDDKFSTTGSANGITTTGASYVITIDNANPLLTEWGCRWIQQGKLTITVGTQPSVLVDYSPGTGTCNPDASFTIYGTTYNFQMP